MTIVFGGGGSGSVAATTNDEGGFLVQVPVTPNERGGDRTIVVQSADGVAATTAVKVIEESTPMIDMTGFGFG